MRDIGAKSTGRNIVGGSVTKSVHGSTLSRHDLDNLNRGPSDLKSIAEGSEAEGRSIKSEYDYGSRRKFVDVLGNVNKKNSIRSDFEKLDAKKMDTQSIRSKYSRMSSHKKAMSMT